MLIINNKILLIFCRKKQTKLFESVGNHNDIDNQYGSITNKFQMSFLPNDFLNFFMKLKVYVSVIHLCKTNTSNSLYNRTKLILTHLHWHFIKLRIIQNVFRGRDYVIFCIKMFSKKSEFLWTLTQEMFSIRFNFTLTINKPHGQLLAHFGISLCSFRFFHLQFYMTESQCQNL